MKEGYYSVFFLPFMSVVSYLVSFFKLTANGRALRSAGYLENVQPELRPM
jgi:hypothetical protein